MNDILIKHHISHNITSWIYEPLNPKQFNQSSSLFPPPLKIWRLFKCLRGFLKSHPRLTRYHLQHQDKCLLNSKGELPFEKSPYKLCFLGKAKSEKLKSHVMWGSLAVAVLRFSGETICLSGSDIIQTLQSDIYFSYENLPAPCQISKNCRSLVLFIWF